MIKKGDKVPFGKLSIMKDGVPNNITTDELFDKKKVVLFSVPGAYTPTCSKEHLPGFIKLSKDIKSKNIDTIACLAVNDVFVMSAWGESNNSKDDVIMLADGNGTYTKALGLDLDLHDFGMGNRGQRFALVINDNIVEEVLVEQPGEFKVSSAENVLSIL